MATPPPAPRPRRTRILALLLGVLLVAALFGPSLARPEKAQAFPGEAMAAAVWKFYKEQIEKRINKVTKGAADLAFKNALKVYLTKMAEDTAVWVASAGTGQKPLFLTDPKYFSNLTDAAAGDFLDTLASKTLGVDVCKPADPQKQFTLQTGLAALINPTNLCQSQCKRNNTNALTDVEQNRMQIGAAEFEQPQQLPLTVAQGVLDDLKESFNTIPDCKEFPLDVIACAVPAGLSGYCNFKGGDVNSSLGSCIQVYERDIAAYKQTASADYQTCLNLCSAQKRVARCTASQAFDNFDSLTNKEFTSQVSLYFDLGQNDIGNLIKLREQADEVKELALEAYQVGKEGVQAIKNPASGEIKTSADLTGEAAKEGLTKDPSGSVFSIQTGSPIADAIGVFTNTLTKRLLQRIFEKGFNPSTEPTSLAIGTNFVTRGAQAARALFASLAKPDFTAGGSGTALADLAACPDASPGINNCVIDEGFRHAIEQEMTVREAVDGGFLDRNKPFGFRNAGPGANDDVEPDFRNGYPLRSMLILRRLRIVPVGWEVAAQYVRDYGTSSFTLGDVLDGYSQCEEGSASPFCGLVDPNWVFTSPETVCKVSGATAELTSSEFTPDPLYPDAPQVHQVGRVESCVDEQTCLQKNDDGSCAQYGYCVKERPSWKFGGDACPASARSCDTFSTPAGTQLTVLANSVDAEQCTAENAGCQWYCQDVDAETGAFTCTGGSTDENKRYFTDDVKSCPAEAEGCSEFVRTAEHANLIVNGSFETSREAGSYCSGNTDLRCNPGSCVMNGKDYGACTQTAAADAIGDGQQDDLLGWQEDGVTAQLVSGANSGAAAALIEGNGSLTNTFIAGVPLAGQTFTLSFYGATDDPACGVQFGVRANVQGSSQQYVNSADAQLATGWQRFTLTTVFDPNVLFADSSITTFFTPRTCPATVSLDDVQLEVGPNFSDYREYGSENKLYLNGKRLSCRPEEAGCTLYTSATEEIPAVATAADACTADQVGCRAFLEVPVTSNGADPNFPARTGKRCTADQSVSCASDTDCVVTVNGEEQNLGACVASVSLLPTTGTVCSAADVGCEEYTNLDEVAKGGEGKEYYTTIRPCAKPAGDEQNEKTFYTWLGSEQTGYQLKAYLLKPTTALIADDTVPGGPDYMDGVSDIGATQCTKAIYGNPEDPNWSPDCREFFDASLNTYYRLYARTVSVSEDCHPLRNTLDGVVYNAIPSEGTTCAASAAQCREYRGPAGYNTRTLLADNFDDGDTLGWSGGIADNTSLTFGGRSMRVEMGNAVQTDTIMNVPGELSQGKSYLVSFWAGAASGEPTTIIASFAGDPQAFPGEARLKWDAAINAPQWNAYTLGPFHLNRPVDTDDGDGDPADDLKFVSLEGRGGFYLDNVVLTEVTDNVYLIKGTSTLCGGAEGCDRYTTNRGDTAYLKSFTRLCSEEKVGCEALINTYNSDSPFGSVHENGTASTGTDPKTVPPDGMDFFVNDPAATCSSEYQGCSLLGKPTFGPSGATCSNDPTKRCTADTDCGTGASCVTRDVTLQKYDTVYLADDPDTYGTSLCRATETGCDAWTNTRTNTVSFFRHPEPFTCEYRTVTIGTESFTGWYKTGTSGLLASDACPTASPAPAKTCSVTTSRTCTLDSDCPSGEQCRYAIAVNPVSPYTQPTGLCADATTRCTVDADCTGIGNGACTRWAGICSTEQAGCREYRDESEPEGCYAQCLLTVDSATGMQVPVDENCRLDTDARCSTDASKICTSDAECPDGGKCGTSGCRGYWYLESTVTENASECNGVPNEEIGCKAFYTPDGVSTTNAQ